MASVPSDNYLSVGQIIRQDFVELSSALEKASYDYFENEITKRKLSDLSEWHKYPRQTTESRLSSMVLLSNWEGVQEASAGRNG